MGISVGNAEVSPREGRNGHASTHFAKPATYAVFLYAFPNGVCAVSGPSALCLFAAFPLLFSRVSRSSGSCFITHFHSMFSLSVQP